LRVILEHLPVRDIIASGRVCGRLYALTKEPSVWRRLMRQDFLQPYTICSHDVNRDWHATYRCHYVDRYGLRSQLSVIVEQLRTTPAQGKGHFCQLSNEVKQKIFRIWMRTLPRGFEDSESGCDEADLALDGGLAEYQTRSPTTLELAEAIQAYLDEGPDARCRRQFKCVVS